MSLSLLWVPRRYGVVLVASPAEGEAMVEPGPRIRYTPEAGLSSRRVRVYDGPIAAEANVLYDSGWLVGDHGLVDVPEGTLVDQSETYYVQIETQFNDGRPGLSEMRSFTINWNTIGAAPEVTATKVDMCNAPGTLPRIRLGWAAYDPVQTQNLVIDASFAEGIGTWTDGGTGTLTAVEHEAFARFGGYALKLVAPAIFDSAVFALTVPASTQLRQSVYIYSETSIIVAINLTDNIDQGLDSGSFTIPAGVLTRIDQTITPDTHTSREFRVYLNQASAAEFYIGGPLLTTGSELYTWFEGTSDETLVRYLVVRQRDGEPWELVDTREPDDSLVYFDYEADAYVPYRYAVLPVIQEGSMTRIADVPDEPPEARLEFDGLWLHRCDRPSSNMRFDSWNSSDAVTQPIEVQRVWGRRAPVAIVHEQLYHQWSVTGPPASYDAREWVRLLEKFDEQFSASGIFVARFGRQRMSAHVLMEQLTRSGSRDEAFAGLRLTEVSVEERFG